MLVVPCDNNLESEPLQDGPCRSPCTGYLAPGKCPLGTVPCCPPRTSALLSLGQGMAFKSTSELWSPFCLLGKLNWTQSALTVSKAQLMARATRAVRSTALLFAGCCPTAGSTSGPSGATVAAFLSINKSKLGRAMERQELCRAVKGEKAKANGLKRERKTVQD